MCASVCLCVSVSVGACSRLRFLLHSEHFRRARFGSRHLEACWRVARRTDWLSSGRRSVSRRHRTHPPGQQGQGSSTHTQPRSPAGRAERWARTLRRPRQIVRSHEHERDGDAADESRPPVSLLCLFVSRRRRIGVTSSLNPSAPFVCISKLRCETFICIMCRREMAPHVEGQMCAPRPPPRPALPSRPLPRDPRLLLSRSACFASHRHSHRSRTHPAALLSLHSRFTCSHHHNESKSVRSFWRH